MFHQQDGSTTPLPPLGPLISGLPAIFSKAFFYVYLFDPDGDVGLMGFPLPIQFRPETLKFESNAEWKGPGGDADGPLKHTITTPGDMNLTLEYDTTDWDADVRLFTAPLIALTHKVGDSWFSPTLGLLASDAEAESPPLVRFIWGSITSYVSYVKKVDVDYTWFHPSGYPMRAKVNVSLVTYLGSDKKPLQNPTSRSEARGTYVVGYGETIDQIAYSQYGDCGFWRQIAVDNNLSNPRNLKPGQILKLTPVA